MTDLLAEGEQGEQGIELVLAHDQGDEGLDGLAVAGLEPGELLVLPHLNI